MTSAECRAVSNGFASRNCASGFGVCCVVAIVACGGTVTQNCSYVANPGFPGTYSEAATCDYTIRQCADDICFVRLDFDVFDVDAPDAVSKRG